MLASSWVIWPSFWLVLGLLNVIMWPELLRSLPLSLLHFVCEENRRNHAEIMQTLRLSCMVLGEAKHDHESLCTAHRLFGAALKWFAIPREPQGRPRETKKGRDSPQEATRSRENPRRCQEASKKPLLEALKCRPEAQNRGSRKGAVHISGKSS